MKENELLGRLGALRLLVSYVFTKSSMEKPKEVIQQEIQIIKSGIAQLIDEQDRGPSSPADQGYEELEKIFSRALILRESLDRGRQ